ncbi:hypothetical protein HGRIS_003329 [Hohenbuehelia grisea]|uniref:Uncharacterized protein n=1 Tax=Hohenbuehelia grisea TaxID=104357 RepID=A0ABR3JF39_9AGAR
MTEVELDKRIQRLPPNFGVQHFKKGISNLTQVTGPERKHIARILLACLPGSVPAKAVAAVRHLLDFIHLAQYKAHDEETLTYLQDALEGFHANKDIFITLKCREHFNIPKLHSLLHYADSIRLLRTTDNYNTETFERLHIDFAKKGWRASNKRNEFPQMIKWLTRQEKMQTFGSFMAAMYGKQTRANRPSKEARTVSLNKLLDATKPIRSIVISHRADNFEFYLKDFLNTLAPHGMRLPKRNVMDVPGISAFTSLNVWYHCRMTHEGIESDEVLQDDHIMAAPPREHPPYGRFNTVVVMKRVTAEATGLEGTRIGRLKVIFQLPSETTSRGITIPAPYFWPKYPLAFVQWYSEPRSTNPQSLFYTVRPSPDTRGNGGLEGEVVPLANLRQSCMLSPKFNSSEWEGFEKYTTNNILDQNLPYIVNNFSSLVVDRFTLMIAGSGVDTLTRHSVHQENNEGIRQNNHDEQQAPGLESGADEYRDEDEPQAEDREEDGDDEGQRGRKRTRSTSPSDDSSDELSDELQPESEDELLPPQGQPGQPGHQRRQRQRRRRRSTSCNRGSGVQWVATVVHHSQHSAASRVILSSLATAAEQIRPLDVGDWSFGIANYVLGVFHESTSISQDQSHNSLVQQIRDLDTLRVGHRFLNMLNLIRFSVKVEVSVPYKSFIFLFKADYP